MHGQQNIKTLIHVGRNTLKIIDVPNILRKKNGAYIQGVL